MNAAETKRWLRKLAILAAVPDAELARLPTSRRPLDAGEVLFRMGDAATSAYIVVKGRLKIARATLDDGHELLLDIVGPGTVLGELALFDHQPRSATITALAPAELVGIDRRDLLDVVRRHPEVAVGLLATLAARMRSLNAALEESSFLDVATRLARRLVDLGRRFGVARDQGLAIDVPLAQHDLARMLGVSREAVNKQLRLWEDAEVVSLRRGAVIIRDLAWLTQTARLPPARE